MATPILLSSQSTEPLEIVDQGCQTEHDQTTVIIKKAEYESLLKESSAAFDIQSEIMKIRQKCHEKFGVESILEMAPAKFEFSL